MSIINEALKKTQTNLSNLKERTVAVADDRLSAGARTWQQPAKQPSPAFTPAAPSVPSAAAAPVRQVPQNSSQRVRWYLIVLAEILVLGLIAWTLFVMQPRLFRSSYQPKISSPASAVKTNPVVIPQPAPVVAAPVQPQIPISTPAKSNLVLKGIMVNQNKMVALINGGIYETGDYVDGKRISKITLDRVELLDGEGIVVLSVRNQGH